MLRRPLPIALNWAVITLLCVLGLFCVLVVGVMLLGVFLHTGAPSLATVRETFAHPDRAAALLRNSFVVCGVAVGVSLLLGTPVGFLAFRTDMPLRRGFVIASILAACLPLYIVTAAWMAVCGQRPLLYSRVAAGGIMGAAYVPLVSVLTGVCFAATDPILEEQALLDTGHAGVFAHVTLPLGAWAVVAAGLVVTLFAMSLITVTDILMVRTFAEEVLTQQQLSARPWRAAAVALPIAALLVLLIMGAAMLFRRHGEGSVWGAGARRMRFPLGRARWLASALVGALFIGFLGVPLLFLVLALGSGAALLRSYRTVAPELWASVVLSAVAASLAACLAVSAAWVIHRSRRLRVPVVAGVLLLAAAPAPLVGTGLALILNRGPVLGAIYDSSAVLVLAYVIRVLPFCVLAALPAMGQVPTALEERADLDGALWIQKMVHVVAAVGWRGTVAAWLLGFVLSLAEIGASFLVAPPGRTTLTIRFFTLIHYGLSSEAAGACLLLLGIVILPAGVLAMLLWRALRARFC